MIKLFNARRIVTVLDMNTSAKRYLRHLEIHRPIRRAIRVYSQRERERGERDSRTPVARPNFTVVPLYVVYRERMLLPTAGTRLRKQFVSMGSIRSDRIRQRRISWTELDARSARNATHTARAHARAYVTRISIGSNRWRGSPRVLQKFKHTPRDSAVAEAPPRIPYFGRANRTPRARALERDGEIATVIMQRDALSASSLSRLSESPEPRPITRGRSISPLSREAALLIACRRSCSIAEKLSAAQSAPASERRRPHRARNHPPPPAFLAAGKRRVMRLPH